MSDKFKQHIHGEFVKDPLTSALERAYGGLPSGSLSQSIVYRGINARRHGTSSIDVLESVLLGMGKTLEEYKRMLEDQYKFNTSPVIVKKD